MAVAITRTVCQRALRAAASKAKDAKGARRMQAPVLVLKTMARRDIDERLMRLWTARAHKEDDG
jgi:hypothetical protein